MTLDTATEATIAPVGGPESQSLRERNKARARAEIADAALRLFSARGFEAVTVDEIVSAAGVSRRTFFRYFETKEEALLADYPEVNARLHDALAAARPEASMDAVRAGLHAMADWYIERSDAVLARSRVIRDTSVSLAARNLEFVTKWEPDVAQAIAGQIGGDAGDLLPRTAAAMIIGSYRAALTQWVRSSCAQDLHALIDEALDLIEHGLLSVLRGPGPVSGRRSPRSRPSTRETPTS